MYVRQRRKAPRASAPVRVSLRWKTVMKKALGNQILSALVRVRISGLQRKSAIEKQTDTEFHMPDAFGQPDPRRNAAIMLLPRFASPWMHPVRPAAAHLMAKQIPAGIAIKQGKFILEAGELGRGVDGKDEEFHF